MRVNVAVQLRQPILDYCDPLVFAVNSYNNIIANYDNMR